MDSLCRDVSLPAGEGLEDENASQMRPPQTDSQSYSPHLLQSLATIDVFGVDTPDSM